MITRIDIENFKGIREPVVLILRPLTLLFGANSAGKSSVLHALHFAYETLLRGNPNPSTTARGGPGLDLGGFFNLVHGRDTARAINLRIGFSVDGDLLDYVEAEGSKFESVEAPSPLEEQLATATRETKRASVEVRVRWDARRNEAIVDRCRVNINGKRMGTIEAFADGRDVRLTKLNLAHPILNDFDLETLFEETPTAIQDALDWTKVFKGGGLGVRGTLGALPAGPARVVFDKPEQDVEDWPGVARLLRLLIVGPLEALRASLEGFRYVGPLRAIPPRTYEPPATHDEARWGNGLAAWDVLIDDKAVREQASRWMFEPGRLNSGYRFDAVTNTDPTVAQRKLVLVRPDPAGARDKEVRLHPHDVGVSISQVVPVVVAALAPWATATDGRRVPVSLVAIEQPELHVHPAMQVALGDLFIAASASRQLLIETHSEHLLLRLKRRIRETHEETVPPGAPELRPEQVAVAYVQQREGEGVTVVPLRIDPSGDFLDAWPLGFFDERMKELF